MVGSCRVHLGDKKNNEQHDLALEESSQTVMDLIDLDIENQIQTLSEEGREKSEGHDDED